MQPSTEVAPGWQDEADRIALEQALDDLELVPYDNPGAAAGPAIDLALQAEVLGFDDLVQRARLVHADVIGRRGDTAGAGVIVREVGDWAAGRRNQHLLARSERLLSVFYWRVGDTSSSLEHAVRSVELLEPQARPRLVADHVMGLALAYGRVKSYDAARDRFSVVLRIADQTADVDLRIAALNNLAFVEYWAGRPEASMRVAREMQSVAEQHGLQLEASYLDTLARAQMLLGRYEEAERTLAPVFAEDGDRLITEADDLAEILLTVAQCQRMNGATDRAQASLTRSAQLCAERGLEEVRVRVLQEQAAVLADRGEFREAYEQHRAFHAASEAIFSSECDARARIVAAVFETEEAVRSSERFREMSLRDSLTGLYNRRCVDERFPAMLSRSRLDGTHLSVGIIDLDFFKAVNDQLSHDTGDEVLRRLAPLLEAAVPDDGLVARLGGEEFLLVLPGFDALQAMERCEILRQVIREHAWHALVGDLPVTASIGVSTTFAGRHSFTALLGEADRRLYAAKRGGRDRVVGP